MLPCFINEDLRLGYITTQKALDEFVRSGMSAGQAVNELKKFEAEQQAEIKKWKRFEK